MTQPPVSVIVVSRGRASDLPLCLTGIAQLEYPRFEVVLVADAAGLDAAQRLPFFSNLKTVLFDEANISGARNLGIAAASGDIVAFIDDDAVPEPLWLDHLVAGFADQSVGSVGGFVIGRNGISFQWKARCFDRTGVSYPLEVDETCVSIPLPPPDRVIKTEGTNMALKRDAIARIGGFDPAFRFYLDETDVNLRLADAGYKTAISPNAQVHHGYKASATRRADRAPRDLTQIAASTALFLRKHAPSTVHDAAHEMARKEQRNRALRHMQSGAIEPRDVRRLMHSFDRGWTEGLSRLLARLPDLPAASEEFRPMPRFGGSGFRMLYARPWQARSVFRHAEHLVASRVRCSVFVFSPTRRNHRVRFTAQGVWVQTGGLWGKSRRNMRRGVHLSFKKRLSFELKRIADVRGNVLDPKKK